jgi:hypothetical protein
MARLKRALTVLAALVAVSFAVHYALFGALPLGKPALLEDDPADELDVAESV